MTAPKILLEFLCLYFAIIALNACSSDPKQDKIPESLKNKKIITKSTIEAEIDELSSLKLQIEKKSKKIDNLNKQLENYKISIKRLESLFKFYEYDFKETQIQKIYNANSDKKIEVKLYYFNYKEFEKHDKEPFSKFITYIEKEIPETENIIENTLRLRLLNKLSEEEKSEGLGGEFPISLYLKDVKLKNGTLLLDIEDPLYYSQGGSTRIGILQLQIEKTAKQFPGVEKIIYPEGVFQP